MLADTTNNDTERPSFDEVYEGATNSSNLKEQPERRGSTDVLRDMAMSSDRLGAALHRLRAQWESSVMPERAEVRPMKHHLAAHGGDKVKAEAAWRAEKADSDDSYARALATLVGRLVDLGPVCDALVPVVVKWGWGRSADPITRSERTEKRQNDEAMLNRMRAEVEAAADDAAKLLAQATLNHWLVEVGRQRAEEDREDELRARKKVGAVVRYWLSQSCPRCDGLKFQVLPGTARLSNKMCPPPTQGGCGGTGFVQVPQGSDGRRLANYMDQQAHRYRQRMQARRKAFSTIPTIDKLSKRAQQVYRGVVDPEAD